MRSNFQANFILLITALTCNGCAIFDPGYHPEGLGEARQFTAKQTQDDIDVSLEEFASAEKSRNAFDADLVSHGVLALLLSVENKSEHVYEIEKEEIKAVLDGQALPGLSAKEAADQSAGQEFGRRALAKDALLSALPVVLLNPYTTAIVLIAAPFVASRKVCEGYTFNYTCAVDKIRQHFKDLEFNDTTLKPNEAASGFVYFKLPGEVKKLENLIVGVKASQQENGKSLSFELPFATLELSGPIPTSETSGGIEEK